MDDRLERNKRTVTAFYDLMFNECRPAEAIEHWDVLRAVPQESANNNTMF